MKIKKFGFLLILVLSLAALTACSGRAGTEEPEEITDFTGTLVYYINSSETAVETLEYEPQESGVEEQIDELLELLCALPDEEDAESIMKPAIPQSVSVLGYELVGEHLNLHFDAAYLELESTYEILCRSAVVRTLCQIDGVEYVSFFIGSTPYTDSSGNSVGAMNLDSFVENPGEAINIYTDTTLTLYFANADGDRLVEEKTDVRYSSNMSVEKLVVEELIEGPSGRNSYPTIPADTRVLNVSTKEGVCYVNLDEGFLEEGYDVLEAIPIYSIVNSLTELPNVNKVQILINGETNLVYRESIRFDTIFERNLDILEDR